MKHEQATGQYNPALDFTSAICPYKLSKKYRDEASTCQREEPQGTLCISLRPNPNFMGSVLFSVLTECNVSPKVLEVWRREQAQVTLPAAVALHIATLRPELLNQVPSDPSPGRKGRARVFNRGTCT